VATQIILGWAVGSGHGWGVYGLNLALNWAADRDIELLTATDDSAGIEIDPLRACALLPFIRRSVALQEDLKKYANQAVTTGSVVLAGLLGETFHQIPSAHNVTLTGTPTIAEIAFEFGLSADAVERARAFPCIVTGSKWNTDVLEAYGVAGAHIVHQGIDPTFFHPGPKMNFFGDRFLIFSGGKAEYRKAQDIVLAAFKVFSDRHPEAMLVTAWYNHWPQLVRSLDWSGLLTPIPLNDAGQINLAKWADANGVRGDRIIDLGWVPHHKMPSILREMDVALFPNRAEGCTNLVAMECMACGLPVILSRNTGHNDIVIQDACYALEDQRQTRCGFPGYDGVSGWGESQLDEVLEQLEQVFHDRTEASRRGNNAARALAEMTWAATAAKTKQIILEHRN
jgi:glycosyltransferase involved in cell wall biosynthesis